MGEYLVGAYLQVVEDPPCEFVVYNTRPPAGSKKSLGELDVIGLRYKEPRTAFLCEVITHIRGLLIKNPETTIRRMSTELVISVGLDHMLREVLPKEETLLNTMTQMFNQNPEFVCQFVADAIKKGGEEEQRERIDDARGSSMSTEVKRPQAALWCVKPLSPSIAMANGQSHSVTLRECKMPLLQPSAEMPGGSAPSVCVKMFTHELRKAAEHRPIEKHLA
jgi:hypothetical protein